MKSTIKQPTPKPLVIEKYPCIVECIGKDSNGKGLILYLTGPGAADDTPGKYGKGIVIHPSEDNQYVQGYECSTWLLERFRLFNGEITLSN